MIFVFAISPNPGEVTGGQRPPATGSAALYWCHEKTEAALHRPIKVYQQLAAYSPQPISLSFCLSVSLPQSVALFQAQNPHLNAPSFNVFLHGESLCPLTPSRVTNIYSAASIYSRLITER